VDLIKLYVINIHLIEPSRSLPKTLRKTQIVHINHKLGLGLFEVFKQLKAIPREG
jgi:hypothetical protein